VFGKFFRSAQSPDDFLSPAARRRRLRLVSLISVAALIGCVLVVLGTLWGRRALRAVYRSTSVTAVTSLVGYGEGHVRYLKAHPNRATQKEEDWFQFRGPGGQGHSAARALPVHWSATENVRWKRQIPGKGWSSPVALGDRIFLTTAIPTGETHELHALALDAGSGEIEWDATVFASLVPEFTGLHGRNSYATPTPLVDGNRIFVHFGPHGTACLNLDGETIWKTRELKYESTLGGAGSPALVDGILIISCDGSDKQFVVGLDANTGKIRWKTNRRPANEERRYAFSTPLVIDVGGKKQVVSSGGYDANSFDPQTGADIWRVNYGGCSTVTRPVFGNGMVYFTAGYSLMFAIHPDGHGDIGKSHVAWRQAKSMPKLPSPLLEGESLYLIEDAGIASCLDALTGKPRWVHRVGGEFSASPLMAAGKIYALDEVGTTTIFAADSKQYVQIAKNSLNQQCMASPGVIDNALLIRTLSSLYRSENEDAAARPSSGS
jgi:outer membrane protein assembly factor BamB